MAVWSNFMSQLSQKQALQMLNKYPSIHSPLAYLFHQLLRMFLFSPLSDSVKLLNQSDVQHLKHQLILFTFSLDSEWALKRKLSPEHRPLCKCSLPIGQPIRNALWELGIIFKGQWLLEFFPRAKQPACHLDYFHGYGAKPLLCALAASLSPTPGPQVSFLQAVEAERKRALSLLELGTGF